MKKFEVIVIATLIARTSLRRIKQLTNFWDHYGNLPL